MNGLINRIKLGGVATLLVFNLALHAQVSTSLADGTLNLTEASSAALLGEAASQLPEILISAFKKGELQAYTFGFQKQPVYGQLKQWPNPKPWVASSTYNKDDSVLYKGKLYRYMFKRNEPGVVQLGGLTPDIAPDAYDINDYWLEYKRVPPIVGYQYSLPAEKDILKVDEWESVKAKAVVPMPEWMPKRDYYMGDVVAYKGKTYECIRDNVSTQPTNQDHWALTYRGVSDNEFTKLQFVYNKDNRLPVAFQLVYQGECEMHMGFYVDAVRKYLTATNQKDLADKLEGLMREKVR
jgi:chitodextrinase